PADLAARDTGGAWRTYCRTAGEADAITPRDVLRRRLPAADGAARRTRRIARRAPDCDRARRFPGNLNLRRFHRGPAQSYPFSAFMRERLYAPPGRAHECPHADLHARARRGEWYLRARIRTGRTCRRVEDRSDPSTPAQ